MRVLQGDQEPQPTAGVQPALSWPALDGSSGSHLSWRLGTQAEQGRCSSRQPGQAGPPTLARGAAWEGGRRVTGNKVPTGDPAPQSPSEATLGAWRLLQSCMWPLLPGGAATRDSAPAGALV